MFYNILLFVLLCVPAGAAEPLTLPAAKAEAMARNPSLTAQRSRLAVLESGVEISAAYPNPRVEIQKAAPGDTGFYEIKAAQPVPLTREVTAAKNAAQSELDAARLQLRALEQTTLGEVSKAWYTLLLARERQNFEQTNLLFAADLEGKVALRRQTGQATSADMARAQVETSRSRYHLDEAVAAVRAAQAALNCLLGRQPQEPVVFAAGAEPSLAPAPEPLMPLAHYTALALANRLEPQAMAQRRQAAGATLTLEKNRRLPVPELGFIQGSDDGQSYSRFYLGVQLPLWYRNSGQVNRARAEAAALTEENGALELEIQKQVYTAWVELELAQKRVISARGILLALNDLRRTAAQDYLSGRADAAAYYETNRVFIEENISYLDALTAYYAKTAELNAAANITENQ